MEKGNSKTIYLKVLKENKRRLKEVNVKYIYKLKGLDCPNCAAKIEKTLNEHEDFYNVTLNFATLKISYETNIKDSFKVVNKIIKEIEPNVRLIENEENIREYHFSILIISVIFGIIGCLNFKFHEIFLYVSYILLLYKPFKKAINMLIKSKTINENMLITISCIGAFLVGESIEGMMVATLYMLGKILEEKAINKTRNSVSDLLEIKQDYANLKVGEKIKKVKVSDVKIDDILCIKKGEKVPVDGIVISGKTKFNTSALTGESEPLEASVDTKVLSGFVNLDEVIYIKVLNLYKDSMVSKILELVESAGDKKAKVETTVSKLSKIYTPTVLLLAILTALLLPVFANITYSESIYRALTFLVIACPCAIAISIPLSYFTGIGVASKNGILIKGSNYLDNLRNLNKIIFDKTGTITTGTFKVLKIDVLDDVYSRDEIIEILRHGESLSNHPIAKSIMKLSDKEIDNSKVTDYEEITGFGIRFKYNKKTIEFGSSSNKSSIDLKINSKLIASIYIDDGIKENASRVIKKLHDLNIKTYMFTGDKKEVAKSIAESLEIDSVYSEMLPTDKYKMYEKIEEEGEIVAFVGDGINDSLVIKRAGIGISMGGIGADSTILASDIVIMNDDLEKIIQGIKISQYTNKIIKENLIGAISVKALILLLSIFGLSSMWFAVFADTGLTVLTILNTLRIMFHFKKK